VLAQSGSVAFVAPAADAEAAASFATAEDAESGSGAFVADLHTVADVAKVAVAAAPEAEITRVATVFARWRAAEGHAGSLQS